MAALWQTVAEMQTRDLVRRRAAVLLLAALPTIGSRPPRVGDVFLALLLTTVVSTPMGWLIAALVPRELEGTLLLIGLVGLQVSIPVGGPDWLVPYWAPLRLTDYDRSPIGPGWPILHALTWAVLVAVVAIALWRRRVAVHVNVSSVLAS
jgi:hypothetical protein